MKDLLIVLFMIFLGISALGLLFGSLDSVTGHECKYESIGSRNPGYFIGCELFKPRFKNGH